MVKNAYFNAVNKSTTPQTQPLPGREVDMTPTNAGGFAFTLDKWSVARRFMVMGSEGGIYYVSERDLTTQNVDNLKACLTEDGPRVVALAMEISDQGLAPKNSPAIFALALAMASADFETRHVAYIGMPLVIRTAAHLYELIGYVKAIKGGLMCHGLRKAINRWFIDKGAEGLAYQFVKYQQRQGWSAKDVLILAHPKPNSEAMNALYHWVVTGERQGVVPDIVQGMELVKLAEDASAAARMIGDFKLPWEAVPTQWLREPMVWEALLPHLGLTALIRNLGRLSNIGLLVPLSAASRIVREKLTDEQAIKEARLHPLNILISLRQYEMGRGDKGSLTWEPVQPVVDALNDAFYLSFKTIEPTGKRILYAIDVSGSMAFSGKLNVPLAPREVAAAMCMASARVESEYHILGFCDKLVDLGISPKMRLDQVVKRLQLTDWGATDCALPMVWARETKTSVDAFVVLTDNETGSGGSYRQVGRYPHTQLVVRQHPSETLKSYRAQFVSDARLVVQAFIPEDFSIADPSDHLQVDVCGVDSGSPQFISDFIAGRL